MSDSPAAQEPKINLVDKIFFWDGVVFAVWIILAVIIFEPISAALFWSDIVSGVLLLALGAATFRRYTNDRPIRGTVLLAEFLLGAWVIGSPVLFEAMAALGGLITWTNVLPGMLIALSAGAEALLRIR